MKKVLFVVIACCLCIVSSSSFARTGSGKDECYGPLLPVNPTPPVVNPVEPEVPVPSIDGENAGNGVARPSMPAVNPSYIAQNKAKAVHHHKSWWDKHGDDVIVGTVVTAAFVGIAVYAFGMEQSRNDPTKVTLMRF